MNIDYESFSKEELIGLLCDAGITPRVKNSRDLWEHIEKYGKKKQEHFGVVLLNGSLQIVGVKVVSIGIVNRTLVHPREVFRPAIRANATALILFHNHPSGNLNPSSEDEELTSRLQKAGQIMGIEVVDHLIVGKATYFSMKEEGYMS